jgi:sn-glycerol 3-phosphate transport system ATP-binding protein
VFQNYALYPHMSVFDNMAYGLRIRGLPKDDIARRVNRAAGILELGALLARKPRELSGGQRQRVAMGRAIVREPAAFLFDEPLSNLDAKLRVQMRIEIKHLHRDIGTTSVYVTHDQVEAMTLGDRLIVMNAGRAEQIGAPIEVYERPATTFVAGFIGSDEPARAHRRRGTSRSTAAGDAGRAEGGGTPGRRRHPARDSPPVPRAKIRAGKLEMVEQLGADSLLHLAREGATIVVRVPHGAYPAIGTTMHVAVDPARVHLFDASTGARIP